MIVFVVFTILLTIAWIVFVVKTADFDKISGFTGHEGAAAAFANAAIAGGYVNHTYSKGTRYAALVRYLLPLFYLVLF